MQIHFAKKSLFTTKVEKRGEDKRLNTWKVVVVGSNVVVASEIVGRYTARRLAAWYNNGMKVSFTNFKDNLAIKKADETAAIKEN